MKKDIIRPGDIVRIVNPEFFLRCGYPLTLKDGIKMIMDDENGITALEDAIKIILEDKTEFQTLDGVVVPKNTNTIRLAKGSKDFYNIVKILAYYRIRKEKFGGRERKIYTRKIEKAKDYEFIVLRKKMVVTGNYIPPSKSGGYEYEEWDPPYLDNAKSHMILYLNDDSVDGENFYVDNVVRPLVSEEWRVGTIDDLYPLAIERCNVEKVKNENE